MMETDRLVIRSFQETDIDDFYEYMKLDSTAKYEDFSPYSYEECVASIKRRAEVDYVFAVVLKQENKLIGDINYSEEDDDTYEIGYDFNEFFWGHGYAAESCKEIIRHLFETVGARRVIAQCNDDNDRSIRLLEKLGFRKEGCFLEDVSFKEDENGNPIYVNSVQYAMLKREWDCN